MTTPFSRAVRAEVPSPPEKPQELPKIELTPVEGTPEEREAVLRVLARLFLPTDKTA